MQKAGRFLFESQLKWDTGSKGKITFGDSTNDIVVETPKVFKGFPDENWSPEHLLISAVSSCFMTTLLFYAKQKELSLSGFKCEAIGQVELHHGKLKFTEINIYPVIEIGEPEFEKKAAEVIELTKQNCLISKALSVIIYYHPTIEIMPNTFETTRKFSSN